MGQVNIRKDEERDALTADIVWQGRHGVAQIRAVVPLGPIRQALQMELAQKGVPQTAIMGHLYDQCERKITSLAGVGLMHTIQQAARAPHQRHHHARRRVQHKMAELVGMAQSGAFDAMGGWPAIINAVQRKHHAHMQAAKARGIPPHVIMGFIQRMAAEDLAAIEGAARIMGDDNMGSIFSSIKHAAKKAGGAVSSAVRRTAGVAKKAVNLSQKLSPSHYLINKATGGMADRLSPAHFILNTVAPKTSAAHPSVFGPAFRSKATNPVFARAQKAAAAQMFRGSPGASPGSPDSSSDPYADQGPASGPDIAPAEQPEFDGPPGEEPQMQEAQDGGASPEDESQYPPEDGGAPPEDGGMSPDDGGEPIDATQPYGG